MGVTCRRGWARCGCAAQQPAAGKRERPERRRPLHSCSRPSYAVITWAASQRLVQLSPGRSHCLACIQGRVGWVGPAGGERALLTGDRWPKATGHHSRPNSCHPAPQGRPPARVANGLVASRLAAPPWDRPETAWRSMIGGTESNAGRGEEPQDQLPNACCHACSLLSQDYMATTPEHLNLTSALAHLNT